VEVREKVNMQRGPISKKKRRECKVAKKGGARRIIKKNVEVYEIKKGSAYGNGGGAKNTDGGVQSKN